LIKVEKIHIDDGQKSLLDISFAFENSLAIIGESGSGKSLSLKAILNLLPQKLSCEVEISAGFELINGKSVSFVPQNAFTALSQMSKIGKQFWIDDKLKIGSLLESVGLEPQMQERFASELSGGQVQRVVLAIALSTQPKLLLLDEPTTALDEDSKLVVLELIKKLRNQYNFKIIFVTHEILLAKDFCEDILVIKNGQIVEFGRTSEILTSPKSEYSRELLEANFKNRDFRR
jgi:peptide/nickel transport system ATP-binding protein